MSTESGTLNLIGSNISANIGDGLFIYGPSVVTADNSTFFNNTGRGVDVWLNDLSSQFTNCIITDNQFGLSNNASAGTLTLTNNTISGNTNGALSITNGATVRAAGTFNGAVINAATLDLNGNTVSVVGAFTGAGTVTNTAASGTATLTLNGTGTFGGVIQNGGTAATALAVAGGTVTLTGANTYSGGTTVSAGTLLVQGTAGTGAIAISAGATLNDQVTATSNSGLGSLRQAITNANLATGPGANLITFNIAGAGVQTIAPTSGLPTITKSVVLDATTQPGYVVGTPLIQIDGSGAGNVNGLTLGAGSDGSTVKGLIISNFAQAGTYGIRLSTNNIIQSNWIGLNASGTAAAGNFHGIGLGNFNLIGTNGDGVNDDAERNVISGNLNSGVYSSGGGNNKIAGNYIGTNVAGSASLVNGNASIFTAFADGNIIGTDGSNDAFNANERNVISGSILVSRNTVIAGNYIGINAVGTAALSGLVNLGIQFGNATAGARIGTNADGIADIEERNIISGLNGSGIVTTSGSLVIAGNHIGTNPAGTAAIPNLRGIEFDEFGHRHPSRNQRRRGTRCRRRKPDLWQHHCRRTDQQHKLWKHRGRQHDRPQRRGHRRAGERKRYPDQYRIIEQHHRRLFSGVP